MSRSIHATQQQLRRLLQSDYSSRGEKRRRVNSVRRALRRKRRIKRMVQRERRWGTGPHGRSAPPEAIPIHLRELDPCLHHPVTVRDIRSVLRRLPAMSTNGIASLALASGRWIHEDVPATSLEGATPCPLTGRLGHEWLPGIYTSVWLGCYSQRGGRIELFALAWAPEKRVPPWLHLYLKLRMLGVLVHEVAHHFDFTARTARGRWLADDRVKNEILAETKEYEWLREVVVPYLERAYPEEVRDLAQWMRQHGGVSLPLSSLAGDPRTTCKGDRIRLVSSAADAFEYLVRHVANGERRPGSMVEFARDLRIAYRYDEALAALDKALQCDPHHVAARSTRARILYDMERYEEAERLTEEIIATAPETYDAWDVQADVYETKRRWRPMLRAALRCVELADRKWKRLAALATCARARLRLGDWAALKRDIQRLSESGTRMYEARAAGYRAMRLLGMGRWRCALTAAEQALEAMAPNAFWRHEPLAVRAIASHRLGLDWPPVADATRKILKTKGWHNLVAQLPPKNVE